MNAVQLPICDADGSQISIPVLRDYQVKALEEISEVFANGRKSPLVSLPTGSGKTVIAARIIKDEVEAGGSVLFLAPRRELIYQASSTVSAFGIHHGILLSGAEHRRRIYANVQIASIDTLLARLRNGREIILPDFSLVFVDEAHLSITLVRQRLLNRWPQARRIGLTATPTRKDGRALGVLYDALIEPATTAELTELGYLTPARYFSPTEPDLSRVRRAGGDYNQKDLDSAVNQPKLVADIAQTWLEYAHGRRTVVFCASIPHSIAVADAFLQMGVAAEHVDADTPHGEREATFRRFMQGDTTVLTNCFLASYGFDLPALSCVVLARPTKSLMLYLQMIGRGLRIASGKRDCLILDHAGCVHEHGFAADDRQWTLDGTHALVQRDRPATRSSKNEMIDCPECAAVFRGQRTCPECGYRLRPKGRLIETLDGKLVEVGTELTEDDQDRLAFFCELRGYAREKSYKAGWADYKFRTRYGEWPPREWRNRPAATPSIGALRWIKSQKIRYYKAKKKRREAAAVEVCQGAELND